MANTRKGNVLVVDTSANFEETLDIIAVKLIAGSDASSVKVVAGGSGGTDLYELVTTANTDVFEEVKIKLKTGETPRVEVTGTSAKAFIYLR